MEKSCPQMLFAGGVVQTFAVTPRAVREGAPWVRMGWNGSHSTFSPHRPTSASLVVYEHPSLPFCLTHGYQREGKATWGSGGVHRTRAGQQLPSHTNNLSWLAWIYGQKERCPVKFSAGEGGAAVPW